MTREEAMQILCANVMVAVDRAGFSSSCSKMVEGALDIAIKALEQEPCEDAISRDHFDTRVRSALTMTWGELTDDFTDGVCSVLELLKTEPSVQPKQKTG